MRQLVILAGGKGTRLRERLGGLPKPLIDVCGVPLLERQILLARRYGFTQVLILVNYRADRIADFCASKGNWGLDITCVDDGEPRGTAGAVFGAYNLLHDEFLVMYGDTMLQVDLERFHQYHAKVADAAATIFLHPNDHPQDSDLVELDADGRIFEFHPYPHPQDRYFPNLVNAALYWIRRDALFPWRDRSGLLDFGKDIFPEMIGHGLIIRGYNSPEYIKDVGTPQRIDKVAADFAAGRIERAGLDHQQKAVFVDRDGTLNREVDHLCRPEQFELLPDAETAIRRLNRAEYRVCVVTNQPVIARGECTVDGLRQIHNKMETLLGQAGAYVDRIYYCPHHPDRGFAGEVAELKIACECRKPNSGMIETAVAELNIARQRSWVVGDSTSDMLAAHRAGIRSILVETGYAGLDQKYPVQPDFVLPDLSAAVDFILEGHEKTVASLIPMVRSIVPGASVFVGGQARSGKSTVAAVLRDALESSGHTCHILCTDRWLLSEDRRAEGVLGRHDIHPLQALVTRLHGGRHEDVEVSLPAYLKASRTQMEHVDTVRIHPDDVVIIEGVVALHLAATTGEDVHRLRVAIDEDVRKARILREYRLRGEGDRADQIYVARLAEEVPWIEATAKGVPSIRLPWNEYTKD